MAGEAEARQLMTAVMAAVGEPDLWPDALDLLATFFGGVAAMAEFHTEQGGHVTLGPRNRFISDEDIRLYIDHYAVLCPRPAMMAQRHLPAVQTDRMVGDDKVLDANPFYSELLARGGLGDYLGLRLRLRKGEADVLAVHRLKKDGHATDEEIAWMHELAPFLRSAFRARALFGEAALGRDGLAGSLAALDAPVAFLRRDGQVLFQNDAAVAVLARESSPNWPALLVRWKASAGSIENSAGLVLSSQGGTWSARILDLSGAFDHRQEGGGVYVVVLSPAQRDAEQAAAARHELTQAESVALRHLVNGLAPAEIAVAQGVSVATVRTHISRLHEKFGVSRTLDVVRLAITEGLRRS